MQGRMAIFIENFIFEAQPHIDCRYTFWAFWHLRFQVPNPSRIGGVGGEELRRFRATRLGSHPGPELHGILWVVARFGHENEPPLTGYCEEKVHNDGNTESFYFLNKISYPGSNQHPVWSKCRIHQKKIMSPNGLSVVLPIGNSGK